MSAHTDPVMDIAHRFLQTLTAESEQHDPQPLPVRLARAATVLPVAGVGLLVHEPPDRWRPLAASNETAALVEGVHSTVGDGPFRVAAATGCPVIATGDLLAQQWPAFYELLVSETSIRSILIMPLSGLLHGRGSIVFCSAAPSGVTTIPMIEICITTGLVSQELGSGTN